MKNNRSFAAGNHVTFFCAKIMECNLKYQGWNEQIKKFAGSANF